MNRTLETTCRKCRRTIKGKHTHPCFANHYWKHMGIGSLMCPHCNEDRRRLIAKE